MNLINSATTTVKKSKFIAYFYEINNPDEVKTILKSLALEHKKASHIVYAYRINNTAGKSDDKEPAGSAGLPLYNILEKNDFASHLIVVVRYFGGTKLGFGLLSRTYSKSALQAIKK